MKRETLLRIVGQLLNPTPPTNGSQTLPPSTSQPSDPQEGLAPLLRVILRRMPDEVPDEIILRVLLAFARETTIMGYCSACGSSTLLNAHIPLPQ